MRWWWLAPIVLGIGCGTSTHPVMPAAEPGNLIDGETYAARIAGLRATLARNAVEIDTQPVIDTCAADHGRVGGRCVRCEVASRATTAGVDPSLIDAVAIAFAAYPPAFLAATTLEHVALCRRIRIQGDAEERPPAGVAIFDERRLLISVEHFVDGAGLYEHFDIEQVVHHEVFHLFDHATSGAGDDTDREWLAMNPPGFAYRDPASATDETRPVGFVKRYATTNAFEDRATVFEYLLGQPARLCEIAGVDAAVAAKTRLVWKRVAKVTGDALLRQHAPCVAALGKRPSARGGRGRPAKPRTAPQEILRLRREP